MRRTLMGAAMLIFAVVMMGCTDSFIPCTEDADCTMDWTMSENEAADWGGMVCNLEVSPQQRCDEMVAYLDWLPEWIPIPLPDCTSLPAEPGVCESSLSWF